MEVSEHAGKFSSSQFEVEGTFELGQTVVFQGQGQIVKEEYFDMQDGTKKHKIVIKPYPVVVRAVDPIAEF